MSDYAMPAGDSPQADLHGPKPALPELNVRPNFGAVILFVGLLAFGVLFVVYGISTDIDQSGASATAVSAFLLLGIALLIALAFEFVDSTRPPTPSRP
jgi:PiT family inorganic phosphate transporter